MVGPVLEVHIVLLHGKHGLEIKIPSPNDPNRTSWVVICRGKNRSVNDLHIPNPEHNLISSELLEERQEIEPCSVEQEPSGIGGTCAEQFRTLPGPMCSTKEIIPLKERKWKSISACESYKYRSFSASISKMVMRLERHYDQDEREIDGAVRWNTMSPKLLRAFGYQGARNSSDKDWLKHFFEGRNKMRFEYCECSRNSLVYFRAIQVHLVEELVAPDAIPYNIGNSLYSTQAVLLTSVLSWKQVSLIAGGKRKKGGKTHHLLHTS